MRQVDDVDGRVQVPAVAVEGVVRVPRVRRLDHEHRRRAEPLRAEFRHQRMMRAEEKAARLPAIMTVPLILFILPTLFVVILGPASCSINDSFLHGK